MIAKLRDVRCTECATGYHLPESLIGAWGARVRCRECGARFLVVREAILDRPSAAAGPESVQATADADGMDAIASDAWSETRPRVAAAEVARAVAEGLGESALVLREAQSRGQLFAEAGPILFEAFDDYRRRAGPGASVSDFRAALRVLWDIDVPGLPEDSATS